MSRRWKSPKCNNIAPAKCTWEKVFANTFQQMPLEKKHTLPETKTVACDVFPECVARVSVSLRRCVETVRRPSCEGRMAMPMVSSEQGVTLGGFKRCVASFRLAGMALHDTQTCFVTCRYHFRGRPSPALRRVVLHISCELHCQG